VKLPHWFEGLSQRERKVLSTTVAVILLLFLVVNFYDFSQFKNSGNQIGEIQEMKNNTRLKTNNTVFWQNAKENQGVHVGDKLFTGKKSSAQIILGKNSSFSLGENSLVEFKRINSENIANFETGTYRLFSNGRIKIAINGKIAEIDAQDSEFQIVINGKNDVTIKTMKGNGVIKYDNKVTYLNNKSDFSPNTVISPKKAIEEFTTSYTPRLYDEYKRENGYLQKKPDIEKVIAATVRLPIPVSNIKETIYLKYSSDASFARSFEQTTLGYEKKIHKIFLGKNYWKYRTSEQAWSDTYTFNVVKEFLPQSKPEIEIQNPTIYDIGLPLEGTFSLNSHHKTQGYIIETSSTGRFAQETNVSWQTKNTGSFQFEKRGTTFFRARIVDEHFKLGEWSDIRSFHIVQPAPLNPLFITLSSEKVRLGEEIYAQWDAQESIKKYHWVVEKNGRRWNSTPLRSPAINWFPQTVGVLTVYVEGTDVHNRPFVSDKKTVTVTEPFVLTRLEPENSRRPANDATETDSTLPDVRTVIEDTPLARNYKYSHSFLTIATSHLNIQSKALSKRTPEFAESAAITVDYLQWWNRHGVQGILQKSVFSITSGVNQADILSGEVRYKYRFTPSDISRFLSSFQFSGFLGYEFFRNSKSDFFLSSYSFYKAGLSIDYPFFDRFVFSGMASIGTQSNAFKYETSWDLFYFVKSTYGVGLGYRLSFVEFDLTDEFPTFTPYREGFAQGNLNFRYFF
jgi:hypothetical protein